MEIILFEPEIPPNTGNIARLCAAWSLPLNLIGPLGFQINDKQLKRAGLDYWPHVKLKQWKNWADFKAKWEGGPILGSSARNGKPYDSVKIPNNSGLLFGPETRGLPPEILKDLSAVLQIPISNTVRSVNLATCVGIIAGEAMRQNNLWPK